MPFAPPLSFPPCGLSYLQGGLPSVSDTVKSISDPAAKVDAALLFAEQKQHADEVKWLNGMIKKAKQEAAKADKERRLLELQRKKKYPALKAEKPKPQDGQISFFFVVI